MQHHVSRVFTLLAACTLGFAAQAQATYPEKPVTLVVPEALTEVSH